MTVLLLDVTGNVGPHVARALFGRGMVPWEAQRFEDYLRERRVELPALIGAA